MLPSLGTPTVVSLFPVTSASTAMDGLTRTVSSLPNPSTRRSSTDRGGLTRLKPLVLMPSSPSVLISSVVPWRRTVCGPSTEIVAIRWSPTMRTRRPTERTISFSTALPAAGRGAPGGGAKCGGSGTAAAMSPGRTLLANSPSRCQAPRAMSPASRKTSPATAATSSNWISKRLCSDGPPAGPVSWVGDSAPGALPSSTDDASSGSPGASAA
ncbi:hypothetical protein SDC9_100356 [bioreactor metagenome]|uniref:Uncharacterized protein n=1 Tax=bioreactor metagenome TaxID=1076179 RepID=A0A645ALH5_9ZZZZ